MLLLSNEKDRQGEHYKKERRGGRVQVIIEEEVEGDTYAEQFSSLMHI